MNVRQRQAATQARIMVAAQEQIAIVFAMPRTEQPEAWADVIARVDSDIAQRIDIEFNRGCRRIFSIIVTQTEVFS